MDGRDLREAAAKIAGVVLVLAIWFGPEAYQAITAGGHRRQPQEQLVRHIDSTSTTATTATTAPPHLPPAVTLDCGSPVTGDWSWYELQVGYHVQPSTSPVSWYDITYGDGGHYAGTNPDSVFRHRYQRPGVYAVHVVATDLNGVAGTGDCTFVWNGLTPRTQDGGPTARCRDGSYSYADHHQGACSWHGGVAVWFQ